MTTHVMLDLETYGVAPNCPVLAIGAFVFQHDEETTLPSYAFYGVAHADQSDYGLQPELDTIKWWDDQSEEAKKIFSDPNAMDLPDLLNKFSEWFPADAFIWGNGADFDLPILSAAYRAMECATPWKPFNGRCYRTVKNMAPDIKLVRQGTHHNALDDAASQAGHLVTLAQALGLRLA